MTEVLHAVGPSVQRKGDGAPRTAAATCCAQYRLSDRERRPRHTPNVGLGSAVAMGDVRHQPGDMVHQRSEDELLVVVMQNEKASSTFEAAGALLNCLMRAASPVVFTRDSLPLPARQKYRRFV